MPDMMLPRMSKPPGGVEGTAFKKFKFFLTMSAAAEVAFDDDFVLSGRAEVFSDDLAGLLWCWRWWCLEADLPGKRRLMCSRSSTRVPGLTFKVNFI